MIFTGIKEERIKSGLTQAQLGRQIGVDQSAVHLWESGKTLPRASLLPKLARILGCTADDLLDVKKQRQGGENDE